MRADERARVTTPYGATKTHDGRAYSGMRVGATHDWDYPDGRWRERKLTPDEWEFTFASTKRRRAAAPEGSGAEPGSTWHWLIVASQMARKVDADSYTTFMQGAKLKVGHKRASWKQFSYQYPDQPSEKARVEALLQEALEGVRAGTSPVLWDG